MMMIASSSSFSSSFRICLLCAAIASFAPPQQQCLTSSSWGVVQAFTVQPISSSSSRQGTTKLAQSFRTEQQEKSKVVKTMSKSTFDFLQKNRNEPSPDATSMIQKRQFKRPGGQVQNTQGMPTNLIESLVESSSSSKTDSSSITTETTTPHDAAAASPSLESVLKVAGGVFVSIFALAIYATGWTLQDVTSHLEMLVTNPQETLQLFIASIQDIGPAAPLYFGVMYFLAELLAIPATPLTLSAGYLLGLQTGTLVVLTAAVAAASVSFVVGKTVLRGAVQEILQNNPQWQKLDDALGKETGFKLLLLVRLTPLFPFSISNYIYGASAIDFRSYFFATLFGFAPGTIAYVYTGMVGQALTVGGGDGGGQPWYVYAGGLAVLTGLLKLATDVATNVIDTMDGMEDIVDSGENEKEDATLM